MTFPVSVIMPVKNGARFIREAIESVLANEVYELFVVDDHSDDDTEKILEEYSHTYPVHVYPLDMTHTTGAAAARNMALRFATQNYVAFIDADDVWMPEKVTKELEALRRSRSPMHTYAWSNIDHFVGAGFERPGEIPENRFGVRAVNILSNLVCHRNVFSIVGGFDPELTIAEDIDWYNRAAKLGIERVHVNEVLVRKRVHDRNASLQGGVDAHQKKVLEVLARRVTEKMFPVW